MPAIDLHQHLWPQAVVEVLQGRSEPPFARWEAGAWTVRLAGEPPFRVAAADGAILDRAAEVTARGSAWAGWRTAATGPATS